MQKTTVCALLLGLALGMSAAPSLSQVQNELSYQQYRELSWAANRLSHVAQFEPIHGEPGMLMAIGERFGTVIVIRIDARGREHVWKSIQLSGVPDEVLTADLDGDGLEDAFLCRTSTGKVYTWSMDGYTLLWESLSSEYQEVSCFTVHNMDDDPASEIVMIADGRVVYVDGGNFSRQFTSIGEYQATQVRCGDVDGDNRPEVVLNTGQVLDAISGNVEWEDEQFYGRIELLDIDGDGVPEVLTENPGNGPMKVYNIGYGREVRLQ